MRAPILAILVLVLSSGAALAARRPLDLPVRTAGARVPAPAYAGDVVEIRLAPTASALARQPGATGIRRELGVPALDRVAAELGGVRFTPLFRGARAPAAGSSAADPTAFYVAHLPPGLDLERALDRFGSMPELLSAEPIAILPLSAVPNDSLWSSSSWYFQASRRDIHAPEAWDVTKGDTSIVVGILDTGIVPYHPDIGGSVAGLPGQIYTNWVEANGLPGVDDDGNGYVDDIHGWDFVNITSNSDVEPGEDWRDQDNDPNDFVGHGTAVAGLVGALTNNTIGVAGVNWNVRLMPLRVSWAYLGAGLGVGEVRMDFVAEAVMYAARAGIDVINCSFANVNTNGLDVALDAATAAGVTVVTSAGNNNEPNYMATRRDVISVASVSNQDVLSPFSNRGSQVDLAAPGQGIASTFLGPRPATTDSVALRQGSYHSNLSGTSFSSPLVPGGAALLQAQQHQMNRRKLSPINVQLLLFDTADDVRSQNPGLDGQYGNGRLNLERALTEGWRSQAVRLGGRVVGAPAVFRMADGSARVAIATDDRSLVVLNGVTLDTIWVQTLPQVPASGPAVTSVPGQGIGIFVARAAGRIAGYRYDGTVLPGWPQTGGSSPLRAGATVWDLDGDGAPEIITGSDVGRVWAWHADGSLVSGFPVDVAPGARILPIAVSHELPARIAVAADNGSLTILDGAGGVVAGPLAMPNGNTSPVIATVQGVPSVVIVEFMALHALDMDGVERPGFPASLAGTIPSRAEAAIGDVNQNGVNDLVLPLLAPARIEVRDSTGASVGGAWPRPLQATPLGSVVLGDLTASGAPDLMLNLASGLTGFSTAGDSLQGFPKPGGGGAFPTMFDLDGDGTTEVLAGSTLDKLLFAYDAGPGSAPVAAQSWPTFRGDFQRTGCAIDPAPVPMLDLVAPGPVNDLTAASAGGGKVRLRWTASGDDFALGRAHAYDVRYSTTPIDDANFALAPRAPSSLPSAPGTRDSVDVAGLVEGLTYYFALETLDEAGNRSAISNVASTSANVVSPAAVTDLRVTAVSDSSVTLVWTATGDDGHVGRPALYLLRASTAPITEGNFLSAPYSRTMPSTTDAGGTETLLFRFLMPATHYWFALKAVDGAANASPLSNVPQAQTNVGGPLDSKKGIALAPGKNPSRVPALIYWQAASDASGQRQEIRIFDIRGRRRRTLDLGQAVGGKAQWDGNDDDGRRVEAGLYLVRLESGSQHTQMRLVLLP